VDPFHVIQLATDALDEIRREVWNQARQAGQTQAARDLKGARFALWKNPENLTERQQTKLSEIERTNKPLFRAYILKEHLRQIYRLPATQAIEMLDAWIGWRATAGSSRSSSSRARCASSAPGSSPPSSTASQTPASKPSTPRSG